MDEKDIAFKVINSFVGAHKGHFALKYFSANMVVTAIKDYTQDPKLIRASYNQIRRALMKLGYGDGNPN